MKTKRVVVTGAGSGLGRELALRYAREGAWLALADIQEEGLKETLRLVEAAGGSGFTRRCDVRDYSQLAALAQSCEESMQGIDVLINNAGVASGGWFEDLSLEDWDWQISINLMGVVKGCKAFMSLLLAQQGRIINIASMAALMQAPRSEEHTSELQSRPHLVCRLLLEKKNSYWVRNLVGVSSKMSKPRAISEP